MSSEWTRYEEGLNCWKVWDRDSWSHRYDPDASRRRKERSAFADVITTQLKNVHERQSQYSATFNHTMHVVGVLHMSLNQLFASSGEVTANVQGGAVSLSPASLQPRKVAVEIPVFHYSTNCVKVPQFRVIEKAAELQWEGFGAAQHELNKFSVLFCAPR